nr:hypothetical protein CFP56_62176 [Quercus suber]
MDVEYTEMSRNRLGNREARRLLMDNALRCGRTCWPDDVDEICCLFKHERIIAESVAKRNSTNAEDDEGSSLGFSCAWLEKMVYHDRKHEIETEHVLKGLTRPIDVPLPTSKPHQHDGDNSSASYVQDYRINTQELCSSIPHHCDNHRSLFVEHVAVNIAHHDAYL